MAELFHQNYSPVAGSMLLSALVASLPPILLAICLAGLRIAPWKSAIVGATSAFLLAWLVWGMPLGLTVAAATHGMAFGLWPICWIVFSSVMFYNLSVESGDFDVIRRSLARLTTDRRIQILLVAFCFGALIEGIAGFGAPVAITAAMLAGLGFEPIMAAVLALIANTAPVAFGSLGIPVTTLGGLLAPMLGDDTQTTTRALSAMVGRQLPFFSLIIPAYLVVLYAGWGRMMAVFPAVLDGRRVVCDRPVLRLELRRPGAHRHARGACSRSPSVALLLKFWSRRDAYVDGTAGRRSKRRRSRRVASWRAYATYGILIVTVLIGQVGNFAGMSQLQPPANVTALLRCGQIGNRLCPEPWVGEPASVDPQGFRFPVWEFSWPGAYNIVDGKPVAAACSARRRSWPRRRRTR